MFEINLSQETTYHTDTSRNQLQLIQLLHAICSALLHNLSIETKVEMMENKIDRIKET